MCRLLRLSLLLLLALSSAPASAQPQLSKDWNVRNLAWAYSAYDVLGRCYFGLQRVLASRDDWRAKYGNLFTSEEWRDFNDVMQLIIADARKREPEIVPQAVGVEAVRYAYETMKAYVGEILPPWVCDYWRIGLSQALWARGNVDDFNAVEEIRKRLGCGAVDECAADLYRRLDEQGLVAVNGRYCRANRDLCEAASRERSLIAGCKAVAAAPPTDLWLGSVPRDEYLADCEAKLKNTPH